MVYVFIVLSMFTFSLQAMEVNQTEAHKKVVILSAVHDVLLKPSTNNLPLPSWLTAENLEKELLEKVRQSSYRNEEAEKHTGTLPIGIKAWLLNLTAGEQMKDMARTNISYWTQPILYNVAGAAFSPEKAASYLTPIKGIISLLTACKNNGNQLTIATNWNSESFVEVKKQHASVVNLFEEHFISGQLKQLTMESTFFEKIQERMGSDKEYYYIDCAGGQESLDAAARAGITPLAIPDGSDNEKTSALKVLLVNNHLLPTEEPL